MGKIMRKTKTLIAKLCECGCGNYATPGHGCIKGHTSLATRKKISESKLGKKRSQETIEKVRASLKLLWQDPNFRKKQMSTGFNRCGQHMSKEARKKIAKASKGRIQSEESKRKISKANKGRHSPYKGIPRTEETKRKIGKTNSIRMKAYWRNPETRERALETFLKSCNIRPTRPEKRLKRLLYQLFPKEYKYTGDGDVWIGGRNPDFMNVNGQKKVIEMFGEFWHSKYKTGLPKKEHRKWRQKHFAKYGYKCCVVWEHELNNISKLRTKLKEFHNG
jgi:G:T-mismatch repair DNA endonuclease (very short patch repair protein)